MRIKKYTASTMKEALMQIKQDLGEDALILKTSKIPKKLFAVGDQNTIEVTAAIDENLIKKATPLPALKVNRNVAGVYDRPKIDRPVKPASVVPTPAKPVSARPVPIKPKAPMDNDSDDKILSTGRLTERFQLLELREDLSDMKKLLASILATGESTAAGGFAGPWAILYKRLIDSEIKDEIAKDLIQNLKNTTEAPEKNINKKFASVLSKSFPVSGSLLDKTDGPLIVAFVGPTGAGKTTTIAKLASYYSFEKKKTVSIITADTYRIAAIEQIRAFTEIVDIGLQVVFSPDEVTDALEACENDDIVFVDTAGRSQRNKEHMRDLEAFLDELKPDDIHLVLSATTKESDLTDAIKRYRDLNVNRLLFTKLDETSHLGNVFDIVYKSAISVSYLTAGQSVPDDIELAQAGRFVQRMLEGSSL